MKHLLRSAGLIALGIAIAVNPLVPQKAHAADDPADKQEYVVLMKDAKSTDEVLDEFSDDIIEGEETEVLADGQACTLELTNREAKKLEKDKDVLFVEENILFEAETETDTDMDMEAEPQDPADTDIENGDDPEYNEDEANSDGNTDPEEDQDEELIDTEAEPDPGLTDEEGDIYGTEIDPDEDTAPAQGEDDGDTDSVSINWNRDFIHANADEVGQADGSGIRIAVLDSGLVFGSTYESKERIDLVGNELEDNLQLHEDLSGHGTATNTVIAVNSPGADVYSVRILDEGNRAPLSKVVAGIQWAIDNHMDIINMSFGASASSEILHQKLREAYDAGILIIAAAGNTGETTKKVTYPAAYDEVVSVGSCDTEGGLSEFSAKGAEILAPGEGIITESLFGGSMSVEGTSIAAPHVTAAAALIWSSDEDMTSDQVRRLLDASANTTVTEPGIVDAGMAYENREQFLSEYQEGELEYVELEEERTDVVENDADMIVSGCWAKENHTAQALGAENIFGDSVNVNYIRLMAHTAFFADMYYGISAQPKPTHRKFSPLHAYGYTNYPHERKMDSRKTNNDGSMNNNYVADLKYMYRLARHYYDADSISDATNTISDVTIAKANYKILRDVVKNESTFYGYRYKKGVPEKKIDKIVNDEEVKGIIHMDMYDSVIYEEPGIKEKLPGDDGTKEAAAWKILGLAVHMAGDTYAHRTRVPKSAAVKGSGNLFDEDNTDRQNMYRTTKHSSKPNTIAQFLKEENTYGYSDAEIDEVVCRCKQCVIEAVQEGRMEFRDIPYVINEKTDKDMGGYDDKIEDENGIHVYAQRYATASNYAVNRMIAQFVAEKDFSIHFFLPQNYSDEINGETYTLKLNGLKYFILDTGTNWDNLKQSTKDLVEKYSTGTATYF